jgi:hypothetical protein
MTILSRFLSRMLKTTGYHSLGLVLLAAALAINETVL